MQVCRSQLNRSAIRAAVGGFDWKVGLKRALALGNRIAWMSGRLRCAKLPMKERLKSVD